MSNCRLVYLHCENRKCSYFREGLGCSVPHLIIINVKEVGVSFECPQKDYSLIIPTSGVA